MDPEKSIRQRKAALQSSFGVQANALSRKNLRLQARQWRVNACLVAFPLLLFIILLLLQALFDRILFGGDDFKCGCNPLNKTECGVEFSNGDQAGWCAIRNPPANPAFLQMPNISSDLPIQPFSTVVPVTGNNQSVVDALGSLLFKAVHSDVLSSPALSFLSVFPVSDRGLAIQLNNGSSPASLSPPLVAGTSADPDVGVQIIDQALIGEDAQYTPLFIVSSSCAAFANSTWNSTAWQFEEANMTGEVLGGNLPFLNSSSELSVLMGCYEANYTYFPPSLDLNFVGGVFPGGGGGLQRTEGFTSSVEAYLYNRYLMSRPSKEELKGGKVYVPGVVAAYDFKNSSLDGLDLHVWYNKTIEENGGGDQQPDRHLRLARSFNLATKAFLSWAMEGRNGNNNNVSESLLSLMFVKEFPKGGTSLQLDVSAFFGPLLFVWVLGLILPIVCTSLVYEKEVRLRSMMKMHGLGDGAYWAISYLYFLSISVLYMLFFVAMGNAVRVKFFTLNDTSILIVFLFLYFNNLVAFGFLWSAIFSSTKTVGISAYLYVFGSGLLGDFLFRFFLENTSTSRGVIFAFELVPSFALYRGLWEFANYSFEGNYQSTNGMRWSNLSDAKNGLGEMMGIFVVEWIIFLVLALYLDKIVDTGAGVPRHPLFFLDWCFGRKRGGKKQGEGRKEMELPSYMKPTGSGGGDAGVSGGGGAGVVGEDVAAEKQTARSALEAALGSGGRGASAANLSMVCDELQKVYKGTDGNPDKYAVKGMSLAVPRGECFGMLGPNGAGKTTSINMMVGFLEPTSGTALIEGMDIGTEMSAIHSVMGVCPQHDLLWETLTGREHLLFYGRLKNLKGEELDREIEMWLRKMNLYNGGVLAKPVRAYSGGMKRRLSVAISLIGDPLVVYMDEPSTGLDPASRNNLWQVVKEAKKGRAIILTTHSMEEAEVLCDRLGIFVDGQFACIGNPRELTARYGGTYDLTVTTPPGEESVVERLALALSARAKRVYSLGGTQKFELPSSEVDLADVFNAIERAKTNLNILAWGIANTTLEDVFIKVAGKK